MKKYFLLTTTLLFSLFAVFSVGVQPVFAQMMDQEGSLANSIISGSLDIAQTLDSVDISMFTSSDSVSHVEVKREGSLGLQYQSSYTFESGDESFCQSIYIEVTDENDNVLFGGLLSSFTGFVNPQQLFPESLNHKLTYVYSLDAGQTVPAEATSCQFLLITQAWQLDQLNNSAGYFDFEETTISLSFDPSEQQEVPPVDEGKVVINEVFEDGTNGLEWVELYNNNSQAISLYQWSIKDKTDLSIDVLPDVSIPGKSFALIVTSGADSGLISQLNTSGVLVIQLDNGTIGNGLNTAGDELYLKNEVNEVVDSLSWGSEHGIFSMPNLADGDSYSRVSTGIDTDSESDWERLQVPSPGS